MSDREPKRGLRWEVLLHRARDPVFVLDRRHRLLYVNQAWEARTGISLDQVRGLVCRHPRSPGPEATDDDLLAHLLTAPADAVRGQFARVRRIHHPRNTPGALRSWWDIEFFPLQLTGHATGVLIVGKVLPQAIESLDPGQSLPERLENLGTQYRTRFGFDLLASQHSGMQRIRQQARLAAEVQVPVLLVGEAGTGKKTLARIIHQGSAARERPLATLDCRKTPPGLLLSLLFDSFDGDEPTLLRGPGSLYLIEPSYLPRDLQYRLVQWLVSQEPRHPVPRLLVGSRTTPEAEVAAGRLLPDLAWRMATLRIDVPPLRHRRDDIPDLICRIIGGASPQPRITPEAVAALQVYTWPENLAELREVLRAVRRRTPEQIDLPELPRRIRDAWRIDQDPARPAPPSLILEDVLQQVERRLVQLALDRARGNRSRAAELLGLHRSRLLRRLEALGMEEGPDETD
ncbi:MAG: sigma 54-interacting transcriptional regulator [Gemmataceae bacterium]